MDEPTTGLHRDDVDRLLGVLDRLVERGDTVAVIEHHPDVMLASDWIIDLGPEGGNHGGRVVAQEDAALEIARIPRFPFSPHQHRRRQGRPGRPPGVRATS